MNKKYHLIFMFASILLVVLQQAWQYHGLERGYHRLSVGMTQQQVLAIMGQPSAKFSDPVSTEPTWNGEAVNHQLGNASYKWCYNMPLAFYKSWCVGFNGKGQLVARWEPLSD